MSQRPDDVEPGEFAGPTGSMRLDELQRRLRGLVGRAANPDGIIRVACSATHPLSELYLAPEVPNTMSQDELAAQIIALAKMAAEDLDRQRNRVVQEAVTSNLPDALRDAGQNLHTNLTKMFETLETAVEQAKKALGDLGESLDNG